MSINIQEIRNQFPILEQQVHGKKLIYLDNAATTQKPQRVIDSLSGYYSGYNANIHRGIHFLAEKATAAFEETRELTQSFINASSTEEIIFTYGTTDGINLLAYSFGEKFINKGDEIIISTMEHHSNIVPWQILAEKKGAVLKVIPITDAGELDMEAFDALLSEKTKLVSLVHVSNALGTINPVEQVIEKAHAVGAKVLIDGAQAVSHEKIDVQKLDVDFYVFSAHKLYGPTGVGILYGKKDLLEEIPPFRGGGEMIKEVTFEKTTFNDLPYKFEAGTPNIADIVAFKEALLFVNETGIANIAAHEASLLAKGYEVLKDIPDIRFIGTAKNKVSVISFVIEGLHHFDAAMMLDARGIAVRTGHHCTQPLMHRFGIEGTIRASFAVYNTVEEIEALAEGIKRVALLMK